MPSKDEYSPDCLSFLLPSYYGRIFPSKLMYQWLSHGSADVFAHREFSFTLEGDIYLRYQSFGSQEDFVEALKKRKPEKIDIGGIYNQRPKTRDTLREFIPLKKEFVLDIDLTDYDDVRKCCEGAKVCGKCWKFIALAVKILDAALRLDFGFKNILWVYSGRRGVHCWVCDDLAIGMDSYARAAILDYLTVIKGGENQVKKVKIPNPDRIHPFLRRSLSMIDDVFEEICHNDQEMLAKGDKNFEMLPLDVKNATVNAEDRFYAVIQYMNLHKSTKRSVKTAIPELKLQLLYPRLDYNVSKDLNHLLKSPFCIHPKTGQVCVPFDAQKAFEFQPEKVPTILTLMDELHGLDKETRSQMTGSSSAGDSEKIVLSPLTEQDYEKTSLAPYMKVFSRFVNKLVKQRESKAKGATGPASTTKATEKKSKPSMDF